jgi:hypothetical protein
MRDALFGHLEFCNYNPSPKYFLTKAVYLHFVQADLLFESWDTSV